MWHFIFQQQTRNQTIKFFKSLDLNDVQIDKVDCVRKVDTI